MNTNIIECPACGHGDLTLHTQCPNPVYFCSETGCGYVIDARLVRTVPTKFELQEAYQLTPA